MHRSISDRGTDDLSYTKPHFIRHLLAVHKKPVLYVDADCEFLSPPVLIDELVKTRRDFAIYNWATDQYNARFVPLEIGGGDKLSTGKRFYKYAGCFSWRSNNQLLCSGLVQYYGHSRAARVLLKKWHEVIASHEGCSDDEALCYTFNNLSRFSPLRLMLKVRWLPQSYARIAYWIYVKPVINHADFPAQNSTFKPINNSGRKHFYKSLAQKRAGPEPFARDCVIDIEQGLVCKLVGGKLIPIEPTTQHFWL